MDGRESPRRTVVVVEDHTATRVGLEKLLASSGFHVLGTAGTAELGHDLVARRRPDVALVDLSLPDGSGAALARRLRDGGFDVAVLIYTGVEDRGRLREAVECGAAGVALKPGSADELVDAVRRVAGGETYMDRRLTRDPQGVTAPVLSPREREVLQLLADGLTGEEAAQGLWLSPETVRTHVRNAMGKLDAKTRVQAVVTALRLDEIAPPDGGRDHRSEVSRAAGGQPTL